MPIMVGMLSAQKKQSRSSCEEHPPGFCLKAKPSPFKGGIELVRSTNLISILNAHKKSDYRLRKDSNRFLHQNIIQSLGKYTNWSSLRLNKSFNIIKRRIQHQYLQCVNPYLIQYH